MSWASWCRTEVLKLKELPNDGSRTSKGTPWLNILIFLVLSSGIMGLLVQDRNLKIERATESWFRDIQGRPVARYSHVLGLLVQDRNPKIERATE